MAFVVKATSRNGQSLWISRPGVDELRTLVPRELAGVFESQTDATISRSGKCHASLTGLATSSRSKWRNDGMSDKHLRCESALV